MKTWKIKNYEISTNPFNGGFQCNFKHNNVYYWADLCYLHGYDFPTTECMVFASDEKGNVTDWTELYCKRHVDFSIESFVECMEEFKKNLQN